MASTSTPATCAGRKVQIDWKLVGAQMPIGKDVKSKDIRRKLFRKFDPNGNGLLSLAEVDNCLTKVLAISGADECKPAINRAFHAARQIAPPVAKFSNDYVDKNEFRVLLVYLRHYLELWQFFGQIDTSGDRRVTSKEFRAALPMLKAWGIQDAKAWDADPYKVFQRIDRNGGGFVLFDEFSDFCLRNGLRDLAAGGLEDVEERREALDLLRQKNPQIAAVPAPSASAPVAQNVPAIPVVEIDWAALNAKMPIGRDPASKAARRQLFSKFDPNGNGMLSLAEVDLGLAKVLELGGAKQCRPAINKAFHAAREIAAPVAPISNSYIDKNEFRYLLVYLRQYLELWQFFGRIDTSGDRRVGPKEFKAALPLLHQLGIEKAMSWASEPRRAFEKVDSNGSGYVRFDEFSDFCLRHGLQSLGEDKREDAQERQEALAALKQQSPSLIRSQLGRPNPEARRAGSSSRSALKAAGGMVASSSMPQLRRR